MKRLALFLTGTLVLLTACTDPTPEKPIENISVGAYILNNGNYTDNDSNISYLNFETDEITTDIFANANNKLLGNLGQDMIIFGSKMYITVNGSGVVFVTDLDGKIIEEVVYKENNETLSPRYLTNYRDAVYVSYYQGYVGKLDTVNFNIQVVPCGPNPDQLIVANDKLYVATSGGLNYPIYCSTIDIFDAKNLSNRKTIDVVVNPQYLCVNAENDIFLISTGNYGDIPSTLQRIDSKTDIVTTVSDITNPYIMTINDDRLYIVSMSYDSSWNTVCDYYIYNTVSGKVEGKVINDGTTINNGCSIDVNPDNGDVYIGASDYISNGDLYKFDSKGSLIKKYDTGGVNPMGVVFINK